MKESHRDYLEDIVDAMEKAESFISGMDFQTFSDDDKTHFAVVRALEVIGEAVKHVPDHVKKKYPQVPWRDIAGMRDKLIHEYFGVKLKVVWNTVKSEIPELKPVFKKIRDEIINKNVQDDPL